MSYPHDQPFLRQTFEGRLSLPDAREVTVHRVINIVEKKPSVPWQAAEYEQGYDHDPHYSDPSPRNYDTRRYHEEDSFLSNDYQYYEEHPDYSAFYRSDTPPRNEAYSSQQYYGRDDLRHQLSSRNRGRALFARKRGQGSGRPPWSGPRIREDQSYRNSKSFATKREPSPPRNKAQQPTAARSRSNSRNRSFSPDRDKGHSYQKQQQHEHHEKLKEKTDVVKSQTPSSPIRDSLQSPNSSEEKPFTSAAEVEKGEAEAAAASLEPEVTPEEDVKARRWEAINAKVLEIEKHYRQDCETFRTVVKMLVTKEPSLDTLLQSSLDKNLLELRQRCLESLKNFVTELDEILEQPDNSN
uniref:Periphilin-1 C-terminal domain-containing protein n=1 Tax=Nothobranchius kuhntae TaxID=321403 RepID=A0A1A8IE47_NOTKU